jgi:hypothetical protein
MTHDTPAANPLAVIAMFATIAEVSATAVLPFLSEKHQLLYLWFSMLFPCLLVGLFFLTLLVKPTVLYPPSHPTKQSAR